jgi:hypothetical protein
MKTLYSIYNMWHEPVFGHAHYTDLDFAQKEAKKLADNYEEEYHIYKTESTHIEQVTDSYIEKVSPTNKEDDE